MTNKTNKSGRHALAGRALVIALICILGLATACKNDSTKPWDSVTVEFVTFPASGSFPVETLDFSPSTALPKGVTFTLTDNKPIPNTWNSASGFNGQVTAADHYSTDAVVTFTQTFYLKGEKLTGADSQRTIAISVATFGGTKFSSIDNDSGSVTLVHP